MLTNRLFPLILLFLLVEQPCCPAQTPRIDSLRSALSMQKDSLSRVRTLLELCNQKESLPGDSIYNYALRARKIAVGLHDQPHGLLANYYVLLSFVNRGRLDSVLAEDDKILKTLSYNTDRDLCVKYILQRARIFIKKARYKDAQLSIYGLLELAEKNQDIIGHIYGLTYIGWTYMEMEQERTALSWFYAAKGELEKNKPDLDYSPLYSNIAAVLDDLGKHDSAFFYIQKAIESSKSGQDLVFQANALAIQSDIFVHMNRTGEAEVSMTEALAIRRQIGDPFYVLSDMGALAYLYSRDHKTAQGIHLSQEGITLARFYHFKPKELYLNEALAENYDKAGDYRNYSLTLKNIMALKEADYQNNSQQVLADMQAKYETQKKENTIIEQKYKLVHEKYITNGITALFLLTLTTGAIVFGIRRHRRALRMQMMETDNRIRSQQVIDQTREEERKRILADLHDELGSGLSSIRILSDLMIGQSRQELVTRQARKISDISRDVAQGMNTIVWALNNDNDTIQNLCEFIGHFGESLFENSDIRFHLVQPGDLPDLQLSGAHRKNIFLCVKESLHNILKHSGARNAWVHLSLQEKRLHVTITDDGRGLSAPNKFGNGMKNITRRVRELQGQVELQEKGGLSVCLTIPLPDGASLL